MAEGWLRHLGGDRFLTRSAGTRPRHLHPLVTHVMQESGVNVAAQRGKGVESYRRERFDVVVTLCDTAREEFPELPTVARTEHAPFDDPAFLEDPETGGDLDDFRRVRDEIRAFVAQFIARST